MKRALVKVAHHPPPAPTSWVAHSRRRRMGDNFPPLGASEPPNKTNPNPCRPDPSVITKTSSALAPLRGPLQHWWYLLIRKESLENLKTLGFKSPRVVAPNLSFGNREPVKLLEFEIEALASWDTQQLKKAFECQHCLFFRDGLPEGNYPPVLKSSVPQHVDLFRLRQAPAMILATESFAEKVRSLDLQNIVFEEMKVSK